MDLTVSHASRERIHDQEGKRKKKSIYRLSTHLNRMRKPLKLPLERLEVTKKVKMRKPKRALLPQA